MVSWRNSWRRGGRELLRRLFQDRLDASAAAEERRYDLAGEDGVVRTRAEKGRTRPLVKKFGQVTVSRIAYRSPGRLDVHPLDAPAPDGCPLILTFDDKGIVMLPEAVRGHPATAKAAASAENKLPTRLSPGEKNGRKRMAELACVYDAIPVPRTPEDVISTPAQKHRKKAQAAAPKRSKSRGSRRHGQVADRLGHRRHPRRHRVGL